MLAQGCEMMTANWTAIGRRLTVRRTAHRPPWGGRETPHRSIVAPLAATIAATVAVGVGVALAKAERERRSASARQTRERHFGLLADEQLAVGMRRMALGQVDLAIEMLAHDDGLLPAEQAVHETRKSLKRLRALIGLLADELGEQTCAHENAVLRDAGLRLASARDTEVMVNTLDDLIKRHPSKLAHRRGVARLRARLVAERDAAAALALGEAATRMEVLSDLRALRSRVAAWRLSDREGVQAVEPALKRYYRQGRRRQRSVARSTGDRARAMHQWRKRVKDLRYAAEILDRSDADGARALVKGKRAARRRKRARGRRGGRAAYIHKLARQADGLGELLGEEHDLALLSARVRAEKRGVRAGGGAPRGTRRALLKLIARRRKALREQLLRDGKRIYRRSPKRFLGDVRAAYGSAERP
jgi:CHAD domain-containing protein